jgi:hypothetical protein
MNILENQTVKIKSVVAIVLTVVAVLGWANQEHKTLEELTIEQSKATQEQQKQTDLLRQLVTQQADLIKKAAEDAQTNKETLIRIETKLEQ